MRRYYLIPLLAFALSGCAATSSDAQSEGPSVAPEQETQEQAAPPLIEPETPGEWAERYADGLTDFVIAQEKVRKELNEPSFGTEGPAYVFQLDSVAGDLRNEIDKVLLFDPIPDEQADDAWRSALSSVREAANGIKIAAASEDPALIEQAGEDFFAALQEFEDVKQYID